ncbi:hypothetical protein [Enterovirga sp.]|jgi:hypothetical protein|uniref:hypothetical protein n=1 Tax=Enterovirga sp. TaxID=2026350 RepID=UPI00260311B6|nr:hypothetical protein [Enterovirga sp.]MDB5590996.1 hypothetical protein [Enterovirga sp.]
MDQARRLRAEAEGGPPLTGVLGGAVAAGLPCDAGLRLRPPGRAPGAPSETGRPSPATEARWRHGEVHSQALLQRAMAELRQAEARVEAAEARARSAESRAREAETRLREAERWLREIFTAITAARSRRG